jgi:hypothetical protein
MTLTEFLLARIAEDEAAARLCAEMFPSPWEVADRGWRVRIYGGDVPTPDLMSDDEDAMTIRNPVVMEVEPDRHIEDPRWLSERVEHVRRHDPARVLVECEAKRRIVEEWREADAYYASDKDAPAGELYGLETAIKHLASVYAGHPDYREEWRP